MDALVLIDNSKLHEQASLLSIVEYRCMSENLLERSCAITETPHLQILPSNHFRKVLGISLNDRQILKALVLFLSLAVKGGLWQEVTGVYLLVYGLDVTRKLTCHLLQLVPIRSLFRPDIRSERCL